jgi:hypothetical protein
MTKFFGVIGAAAVVAGMALPAMADGHMDVATLTCGAFFEMDAAGRIQGTNAVVNWVRDSANAAAAGAAAQMLQSTTEQESLQMIEAACEGQTVDTNLISVLQK